MTGSREIPEALRAWRERTPGAVIQIGLRSVVLHVLGEKARTFRTLEAACEAVTPRAPWGRVETSKPISELRFK